MRNRIASVAVALALVLSAVGGGLGPVGTAQAQSLGGISNECYSLDGASGGGPAQAFLSAAYQTITGIQNGCYYDAGSQTDYENQTATDLYSAGLGLADTGESYRATTGDWLETSRGVGYYKGKAAAVRGLENGTTESQTVLEAETAVDDYYSRIQYRMVQNWNARLTQIEYMESADGDGTGQQIDDFGTVAGNYGDWARFKTVNETLINGTTVQVKAWRSDADYSQVNNVTYQPFSQAPDGVEEHETIAVKDPNDGSTTTIIDVTKWYALNQDIQSQHSAVRGEMNNYVTGVYQNYSAGDINATQLYQNDPTLLAQESATDYNSTGYYGYSSVQLASIGLAGDTNASHVVTVDGGNNWTGSLYYTGADGTEFQTGETYDFGNLSGSVYMAASSGPNNQTGIVNLTAKGSSFTIQSATNVQTGEAINTTTVNSYVYDDANATNLQSEIDRLEELREFYEEQNTGGGGIPIGSDDKLIIGIVAAAVIVLALRN